MARAGLRTTLKALSLLTHPLHLGLHGRALPQPEFTGPEWYEDYGRRHSSDGADGRLVSMYGFEESWSSWEMHPAGDEVVLCLEGTMLLHQEHADGSKESIELAAGDYAVNPAGTWHTADVQAPALALFITAGEDTQHRPR